ASRAWRPRPDGLRRPPPRPLRIDATRPPGGYYLWNGRSPDGGRSDPMAKEVRADIVFKEGMKFDGVSGRAGHVRGRRLLAGGRGRSAASRPSSCSSPAWPVAAARSRSGSSSGWGRRSRT
ncbi:MAG: hypothetical protein MZV63_41295, partial [Marinilabiliales bacterium]|nr:hypothetical protein [Marinilabiliales bacterium]